MVRVGRKPIFSGASGRLCLLQSRFGDIWGQITWNLSGLSPERDRSSERVINPFENAGLLVFLGGRKLLTTGMVCPQNGTAVPLIQYHHRGTNIFGVGFFNKPRKKNVVFGRSRRGLSAYGRVARRFRLCPATRKQRVLVLSVVLVREVGVESGQSRGQTAVSYEPGCGLGGGQSRRQIAAPYPGFSVGCGQSRRQIAASYPSFSLGGGQSRRQKRQSPTMYVAHIFRVGPGQARGQTSVSYDVCSPYFSCRVRSGTGSNLGLLSQFRCWGRSVKPSNRWYLS